jgi:hypothetical protein
MTNIDVTVKGEKFGDLVAQYRVGHRVVCRCRCTRLVHVADDDLFTGIVENCGCGPPTLLQRIQLRNLKRDLQRTINFTIAAKAR